MYMYIIYNVYNIYIYIYGLSAGVHLFCSLAVIGQTTAEASLAARRSLPVGLFFAVRVQDDGGGRVGNFASNPSEHNVTRLTRRIPKQRGQNVWRVRGGGEDELWERLLLLSNTWKLVVSP